MLFYFLISIVFIAEVIISLALIIVLVKADKIILKYNEITDEIRPSVKSVMILVRKISKQLAELAPMLSEQIKKILVDFLISQFKSMLGAVTFWLVKKEVEKHV